MATDWTGRRDGGRGLRTLSLFLCESAVVSDEGFNPGFSQGVEIGVPASHLGRDQVYVKDSCFRLHRSHMKEALCFKGFFVEPS
jgi:hypothetical protein